MRTIWHQTLERTSELERTLKVRYKQASAPSGLAGGALCDTSENVARQFTHDANQLR